MCDEVIFRGRYLHTIENLQSALGGGEIVPNRQCGYTEDDLLPHCCLCPVDLAQTAAKNGLRAVHAAIGDAADHMRRRIERNQTWKAAGADILRWLESVEARRQWALF